MNFLITVLLFAAVATANNDNDRDEMEAAYFCIAGKTYTIVEYARCTLKLIKNINLHS